MRRLRVPIRAHAAISVPALPWGAALVAPALPATACSPHASAAVPHVCETQRSPAPARRRAPSRIERGRRAVKCLATSSTVMGLRIGCSCGKRQVQRGSRARMLCVQGEQVSSRFHNAHRERCRHAWRACCAGTAVVERAGGAVSRHVRQAPRAASMAREAQTDHR